MLYIIYSVGFTFGSLLMDFYHGPTKWNVSNIIVVSYLNVIATVKHK